MLKKVLGEMKGRFSCLSVGTQFLQQTKGHGYSKSSIISCINNETTAAHPLGCP